MDAQLRVYGEKNQRVADASMPTITIGNTQAPCVIIGEPPGGDPQDRSVFDRIG
ncbi:GMC oxidoreductase [Bradyrhizobium diazoefficiens]